MNHAAGKMWLRWGWAASVATVLAGCGGAPINPNYRPADGNAVQSPYDIASPGDEIFTRQSETFPLVTVNLPNKDGDPAKVNSVLDVLKPPTAATGPAIQPAPATAPVPTQILGAAPATLPAGSTTPLTGATPEVVLPAKVVGQDTQVGDVTASTDASGNLDLFVTSPTGIGNVTLEKTGDAWPGKVNLHLGYAATKPFTGVSGVTASELLPSGGTLPLKTSSSGSDVTVSVPGYSRNARIRIEWVDKYR